jgi:CMP-N-acetylneuraminic acid synthetase
MKILAIVLARKNSKRIKNKNLVKVNKKKLIEYTFDLLKNNFLFERVLVSTDDKKIIHLAKKYSFIAPWIRPKKLSLDNSPAYKVIIHAYKWYKFFFNDVDGIFVFQPTSPFRNNKMILKMVKKFRKIKMKKSIIAISPVKEHPEWFLYIKKNLLIPTESSSLTKQSQNLKRIYRPNGLGYLLTPKDLINKKTLIPKKAIPYLCHSSIEAIDIDNLDDLKIARCVMKYYQFK